METHSVHQTHKPQSTKKEFLIFLSIPITLILIVTAVVVAPNIFAKPRYDFIYTYCASYDCSADYTIDKSGKIVETPQYNSSDYVSYVKPEIDYYYASTNSSKPIGLTDANSYKISSSNVSPDGYMLTQSGTSDSGFLFWGYTNDSNWYLKNGPKKKKVSLFSNNNYSGNIKLLGWVEK